MSIQYLLNQNFSYIENSKLNPNLSVSGSISAPLHNIDTITLSKNQSGNLAIGSCPVVEATQFNAPIAVLDTVNVEELVPKSGSGGAINVDGLLKSTINSDFTCAITYDSNFQGSTNYNGSSASLIVQNESSGNKASSNLYLMSNNATDQGDHYAVIGLNNASYDFGGDSIDSQPEGLYIAGTRGDVAIIGNYFEGGSVHLGYNQGSNAISVMNSGAISLGTTFSGQTKQYTYNAGQAGQVLKSAGPNAPAFWSSDLDTTPTLADVLIAGNSCGQKDINLNSQNILAGNNINCVQVKASYVPAKNWYVSTNGDNANAGNMGAPFLTIDKAIQSASAGDIINILAGSYNESLTVNKALFFKGPNVSVDSINAVTGAQIVGDITVNITTGGNDMFQNVLAFSGLLLNSTLEINSGTTADYVLDIDSCLLYKENGNGRMIHINGNNTENRVWISNSKITNKSNTATQPVVEVSKGMCKFSQVEFLGAYNNNVFALTGSAKVDSISLCSFTNSTTLTTPPALVLLNASGSPAVTLGNCVFSYTQTSDKKLSINSCGVRCSSSAFVILYNNVFNLAGTIPYNPQTQQGNYILKDDNTANPITRANILFYQNSSLYDVTVGGGGLVYTEQAKEIQGANQVNKRSLLAVT